MTYRAVCDITDAILSHIIMEKKRKRPPLTDKQLQAHKESQQKYMKKKMQLAGSEIQVKASFDAILSCLRMNSVVKNDYVGNDYQKCQVNYVAIDAEKDKIQVGVAESDDKIQVGVAYDDVIEAEKLDAVVTSTTSMISVRAIYQESNLAKNRNIMHTELIYSSKYCAKIGKKYSFFKKPKTMQLVAI